VKRIIGCGLRGILLLVTDVADGGVREVACGVRLKKCVSPCWKGQQYELLESALDSHYRNHQLGLVKETLLGTAFKLLVSDTEAIEPYVEAWAIARPDSYIAMLGKGYTWSELSFKRRGKAYSNKTKEYQFSQMREASIVAREALLRSIELEPTTTAYTALIELSALGSGKEEERKYFEEGLELDPDSYVVRSTFLNYLVPKWGGSYREIREVIEDIKPRVSRNPELRPLLAFEEYALSEEALDHGYYEEAVKLSTAALRKADKQWFYSVRARAHDQFGHEMFAFRDYHNGIEFYPMIKTDYPKLLALLVKYERNDEALVLLRNWAKIEPHNQKVKKQISVLDK
jgi:tetratricopeptide (TPR) repeat protein